MRIIETCPAFPAPIHSLAPERSSAACVADPLHAIAGSWLGPVVQPPTSVGEPAPRPASVVRCDDSVWR
jgi:hypothetical protein